MLDPDFELFAAVVANGSIAAAARALGISTAMASKRLMRLERRLGARLLHRTTRRLVLTEVGRTFHEDVIAILDAVASAEAKVSGQRAEPSGTLRLSAPTSFGRLHLAPYVKAFIEAYPKVDLRIDLSDSFVDLFAGQTDLAIRIAASIDPGLGAVRLATSQRVVCASPIYLSQAERLTTTRDLKRHRLLATDGQLPWRLDGPSGTVTIDGRSHIQTDSSEVVRELTLAGIGVALRSLWDVHGDIAEGRLKRVLPEYQGSRDVGIYAVYPSRTLVPNAVETMIAYLRSLYAPIAPWQR